MISLLNHCLLSYSHPFGVIPGTLKSKLMCSDEKIIFVADFKSGHQGPGYWLCALGQVIHSLWASLLSSVKRLARSDQGSSRDNREGMWHGPGCPLPNPTTEAPLILIWFRYWVQWKFWFENRLLLLKRHDDLRSPCRSRIAESLKKADTFPDEKCLKRSMLVVVSLREATSAVTPVCTCPGARGFWLPLQGCLLPSSSVGAE